MAAATLNTLGRTLLAQLYSNVTGGDDTVPAAEDAFISWAQPGIPFGIDAFQFAVQGLSSSAPAASATPAPAAGAKPGAKPPPFDPAAQLRLMLQQAYNFATIVDYVPDVNATYNHDKQQTILRSSEARMSHMYNEILKFSKVVNYPLTPDQQAKLKKFRNLLRVTKTVTDIVTDEKKQVTEDSPMLKAYNARMADYINAALEYNTKRAQAQSASGAAGAAAVADWANNASLYRLKVKAARDAWVDEGYKNEVDEISAYINQTTQRSMLQWKQGLLEMFNEGVVNGVAPGQEFYYTTVIPGDFATAPGWTKQTIDSSSINTSAHQDSTSASISTGVNFGFWSAGGSASHSDSTSTGDTQVSSFTMSFEMAQVVISRPWFYPEWFMNRGWTLRKGEGWMYDQYPSDGATVPKGNFVGYPTTMLFIRNLSITSRDFCSAYAQHQSANSASVSGGWGPFSLGGTYSHASGDQTFSAKNDGTSMSVDGMQLIGMVNHRIGKAPNPLPDIKDKDFA